MIREETAGENEIQIQVAEAYDRLVSTWTTKDPRDNLNYIISKMKTDYKLLNEIEIANKKILNIGCSFPIDEIYFARKSEKWIAIDLSPESLTFARHLIDAELSPELSERIAFQVADACELPFGSDAFDITLSFSTIDHIPGHTKRQEVVRELARVTKVNGYVIITAPNRMNFFYYARSKKKQKTGTALHYYEHCFTPRELRTLAVEVGLVPLRFLSTLSPLQVDMSAASVFHRFGYRTGMFFLNSFQQYGRRMGYLFVKRSG